MTAVGVALVVAAVIYRAKLVELAPPAAHVFAALGLHVEAPGLQFRAVSAQRLGNGSDAVLVVEGDILNASSDDRAVPLVEISVQGDRGEPFYTWTSTPARQRLPATETARFRARLAAPPPEGRRVLVRFAAKGAEAVTADAR